MALLRALLAPADVVVLDEPFKGLDEAARQAAAAYVRRMQAGRTLLCITHEEGDAALLGARFLGSRWKRALNLSAGS